MKVNRSQVPLNIQAQNESLLDEMEAEIVGKLQNPTSRWETCVHESGHGIFRLRAGAIKLIFRGPWVTWNEKERTVQKVAAGIGSEWPTSVTHLDLGDVARYCVAGWIAEDEMTDSSDAEASANIDRLVFAESARKARPTITDEEITHYWDRAEVEVRVDLQNEAIKEEIRALAEDFEKWLLDDSKN